MQDILPRNQHELELWRAFHPEAIYDPEKEELLRRANRRQLVGAYYQEDHEFAKAMDKLMGKITDKKSDFEKLLEKIDGLLNNAEKKLLEETVKEAREKKEERDKELLKLHKAFHS